MVFDYKEYLFQNFWLPIGFFAFVLISGCLVLLFGKRIKAKQQKEKEPKEKPSQKYLGVLFVLIVFGILAFINGSTLCFRGLDLYRDRNEPPLEYQGRIEKIVFSTDLNRHKYHTADGNSLGVMITIDGESFHAMSSAGFEAGDTVRVQYLPNSRCVLEIHGEG